MGLATAALGVSLVAAMVFIVGGRPSPLPIKPAHFPLETLQLTRMEVGYRVALRDGLAPDQVPAAARWSLLAEVACGGRDVYDALFEGRTEEAAQRLAGPTDELVATLACGRAIGEELGPRAALYDLRFLYGDESHQVTLLTLEGELPATTKRFRRTRSPLNLEATRCLVPWTDDRLGDCPGDAPAMARLETDGAWVAGTLDAVRAFGRSYKPDRVPRSPLLQSMEPLARGLADHPFAMAGSPERYVNHLTVALDPGVSLNGEPEERKLTTALREGGAVWAVGQRGVTGGLEVELALVGNSEREAEDIHTALDGFLAGVNERAAEASDAGPERRWVHRAFATAETHREGPRVSVTLRAEGQDAALEAARQTATSRADACARIVEQLARGETVGNEALAAVGEEALVQAVEERRAVAERRWPFAPEAWREVNGFFVPGRGRYGTKYLGTDHVDVFTYPMGRSLLREVFQKVARTKGWKVEKASTQNSFELVNGGKRVGVLVGGDRRDESALVLFVRNR